MNARQARRVEDVSYIFEEAARLSALGPGKIPREDMLADGPPHPGGMGSLLIGRTASERLELLAVEAGEQAGIARRVEASRLRRALGKVLVTRFLNERRALTGTEVDRALASAAKAVRGDMKTIRHLIPCHLMRSRDPEEIVVGPVRFMNRSTTRRRLIALLRLRRDEAEEGERRLDREMMAEAVRYYRHFGWVAEVEIKDCDRPISESLAERAVISALDSLHLLLGAQWTDRMQIGGPGLRYDRRASLRITDGEGLYYSLSSGGFGQVNFRDGWSKRLDNPHYHQLLDLFGTALEAVVDPDLNRPLSRRVLDAAQWFGEAARDPSASTRVVKYVTALERMLMTEERDDISATISARLAAFSFEDEADHADWVKRTRDVYYLRSRLVHGSVSPGSPEVRRGVGQAARVSEAGIINMLVALGGEGLREGNVSRARLARWFKAVVARSEEFLARERSEPGPVA